MLLSDNKKKVASVIVSGLGPQEKIEEAPLVEGAEQDDSLAKEAAAQELISALESKDAKRLAAAFSDMLELCEYGESEPEAE